MVRTFVPQDFSGDIPYNTNFAPQSDVEGGSTPPSSMEFNVTTEKMLFNVTGEEMVYN